VIESHLTALIALAAVLALWVWVQTAWRRSFPDALDDPDALAGRPGCGGCDQRTTCASSSCDEEEKE
jgi:hypothetical protein